MAESPQLPPKKEVATALLQGPSVFVHLDPRREGVLVPNWFKHQAQLVLQIGLNMAVRIPDLDVGDEGIGCTLSFNRSPFWCFMPWTAIYGLVGEDGRGMIWPDDVPSELAAQRPRPKLEAVRDQPQKTKGPARKTRRSPRAAQPDRPLAIVKDPSESRDAPEPGGKKKLPPYLRVIK